MINEIDIQLIKPDPHQPRKRFEGIEELAANMNTQKLIHPIEVDEKYMIIVGERRYRAALLLQWKKILVTINNTNLTPYQRLIRQMSENLHQSAARNGDAMNPLDTANAWARLYKLKTGKKFPVQKFNLSGSEEQLRRNQMSNIIQEVGANRASVWELLQILNEPAFVQKAIAKNKIPYTYIREMNSAPIALREDLRKKIVKGAFRSRAELRNDIDVVKKFPELIQFTRDRSNESAKLNRILNGVVRLGLALEGASLENINTREQAIVQNQLLWIQKMINQYMTHSANS